MKNRKRTPLLEGWAKEIAEFVMVQIRGVKGLVSAIDHKGGINGKWIRVDEPYDIGIEKFFKIIYIKAIAQTEEEYIKDALDFRNQLIKAGQKWMK